MSSNVDPDTVKQVIRTQHAQMLEGQIEGLAANLAATCEMDAGDLAFIPEMIESSLRYRIDADPIRFVTKMQRAEERYLFVGREEGTT